MNRGCFEVILMKNTPRTLGVKLSGIGSSTVQTCCGYNTQCQQYLFSKENIPKLMEHINLANNNPNHFHLWEVQLFGWFGSTGMQKFSWTRIDLYTSSNNSYGTPSLTTWQHAQEKLSVFTKLGLITSWTSLTTSAIKMIYFV